VVLVEPREQQQPVDEVLHPLPFVEDDLAELVQGGGVGVGRAELGVLAHGRQW
jgi:hypothetical protein